ncbi:MAG: hypothetical protein WBA74_02580, partial [Cyclobacteriaceae bacterium]
MKKLLSILLILVTGFSDVAVSQENNQKLEFGEVKLLPATINSKAEEILPVLSADGERIYFVRAAHQKNIGGMLGAQDIWYSDRDKEGNWQEAKNFRKFNNKGNNAVVGVDHQSGRLYLINSYEDNLGSRSGLSYSDPKDGDWALPVVTKIEKVYNRSASNDIYGLSINKESDVLLISMKGEHSVGSEDLYVSFKFTGWNRYHQAAEDSQKE